MSCAICKGRIDENAAPIIAMGAMGTPRYICDECAKDIDAVLEGTEPSQIRGAVSKVADKMTRNEVADEVTIAAVKGVLSEGLERAACVENGAPLPTANESYEDVPDELLETDEDKALDEAEAVEREKNDRAFNLIGLVLLAAAVIGMAVFILIKIL